jgi:leader peptidase (prepilin peptidase)/N-methyltransferase
MAFAIDVAYLDRDLRVLEIGTMRPRRFGRPRLRAHSILETRAGQLADWGIGPGSTLRVETGGAAVDEASEPAEPAEPAAAAAATPGSGAGSATATIGRRQRVSLAAATVLAVAIVLARAPGRAWWPLFAFIAMLGTVLSAVDIRTRRLPDRLTLPAYPVAAVLVAFGAAAGGGLRVVFHAVASMAVMYIFYFVFYRLTSGRGVGFGDVKLAGLIGLGLAPLSGGAPLLALLLTHVLAALYALVLICLRRAGRHSTLALGPFLVIGWITTVAIAGG